MTFKIKWPYESNMSSFDIKISSFTMHRYKLSHTSFGACYAMQLPGIMASNTSITSQLSSSLPSLSLTIPTPLISLFSLQILIVISLRSLNTHFERFPTKH